MPIIDWVSATMGGELMAIDARVDELCVNTIRTLSIDAVQQPNPSYPGTAMAMALVVYCRWQLFLQFDPDDPRSGHTATASCSPSWELFEQQSQAYRDSVIPPEITARVSVDQAATFGWERYVGPYGQSIGMQTFGVSAPLQELQKKFGFTVERIMAVTGWFNSEVSSNRPEDTNEEEAIYRSHSQGPSAGRRKQWPASSSVSKKVFSSIRALQTRRCRCAGPQLQALPERTQDQARSGNLAEARDR